MLLFVFFCGMTFSSSAATFQVVRAGAVDVESAGSMSLTALPVPDWTLVGSDAASESATLAFLGFALIGAAGCWRRVIRRRVARSVSSAKLDAVPQHSSSVPHRGLRAVPRPQIVS